jgi:hypothetical protein
MIDDTRADQLVNPQRVAVVVRAHIGQRRGMKCRIRQLLGGSTVGNAIETNEPLLSLLLARFDNSEPPRPGEQTRTRRETFDSIGDQRDVQLAVDPVGTTDASDFAK